MKSLPPRFAQTGLFRFEKKLPAKPCVCQYIDVGCE